MVTPVAGSKLSPLILKFGGGVNSRASEADIDETEAVAESKNFELDLSNKELKNRQGIDLVGTAPNASSINGYAQLKKVDGTITTLIQAGTTVYSWDGANDFVNVGSVSAGTKLRGPLSANSLLDDKVIIGDLSLTNAVLEWDGSTLSTMSHNLAGTFKARYVFIEDERAFYGNVESNGTATPHLFVGSERSNYDNLSVSDRPSSALGEEDPFFLLTPDLRPINGILSAFNVLVFSSREGSAYKLSGSTSKDYAIDDLFANSGASGDEALTFVGNDVFFGRQGRIESLVATQNFGDIEADDISRFISNLIEDYKDWTIVYNPRTQKVFCFADGKNTLWVLNKSVLDATRRLRSLTASATALPETSPWVPWETQHPIDFKPTLAMTIFDPQDGLQKVFMGDSAGNVYRLEGSSADDAGVDVQVKRVSKLITAPLDADLDSMEGYLQYRNNEDVTVNLKFKFAGEGAFNEPLSIDLVASTDGSYYGGAAYYGGDFHYGSSTRGRFLREGFTPPGRERIFQIEAETTGQKDFNIQEIGIRLKATQ